MIEEVWRKIVAPNCGMAIRRKSHGGFPRAIFGPSAGLSESAIRWASSDNFRRIIDACSRQFHGEPDDARLFGGRQLLDFINDGGCGHVQKILEIPPHSKCIFQILPPSSDFGATRRFWFQLKLGSAARPGCDSTRPASNALPPDIRDEASRTTREGACAPHFSPSAIIGRAVPAAPPFLENGSVLMNGYFLCFPYCYRRGGGQNYTIIRTDPLTIGSGILRRIL